MWFVLFASSCNNFQDKRSASAAKDYQAVLNRVSRLFDTNHAEEGLQLLKDAAILLPEATVAQKESTYLFYYNYYYQVKRDNKKAMLYIDSMQAELNTEQKIRENQSVYGRTFFLRGDLLFEENRLSEAYYNYYRGKQITSATLDDCSKSEYTYRMGMSMYRQQDYKRAATYFKKTCKEINACSLTFGSFYRRQELLNNTGLSYGKLHMNDSAVFYYNKALAYINTNRKKYSNVERQFNLATAVVQGNLADMYVQQGRYNIAAGLYRQSIAVNAKPDYDFGDAELTEVKLAKLYVLQNKPDSLLAILNSLQAHLKLVPNLSATASMKNLLTTYYTAQGNYKLALSNYKSYCLLKDSLEKSQLNLKENDINLQLDRYEKDYQLAVLRKHSNMQRIYLIAAVIIAAMASFIILLIYQYLRKSGRNMKALDYLNKQINQQNDDLAHALNEIKISNQEKDRILHTVAHDLRNPVGGIASLSSTLVNDHELDEEHQSLLTAIRDTANDSLILISELLEVADNQVKEMNRQEVEINQLVVNCIELLNYKAAEKNQTLSVRLLDEPQNLIISREKIWRVLSNLISNAIKFSKVNGEIIIGLQLAADEVIFSVHDNGIGIPDELKADVFNMFTNAKRQGTLGEKSFGLGLSICKQIITQHDGKIWFESSLATGTTFYFMLPLKI